MKKESKISKNKKLTSVKVKRLQEFNEIRQSLLEQGYKEKQLNVSILKANFMALITTVPIAVICYLLFLKIYGGGYRYTRLDIVFLFVVVVVVGIVVHELIHGITWSVFCKKKVEGHRIWNGLENTYAILFLW